MMPQAMPGFPAAPSVYSTPPPQGSPSLLPPAAQPKPGTPGANPFAVKQSSSPNAASAVSHQTHLPITPQQPAPSPVPNNTAQLLSLQTQIQQAAQQVQLLGQQVGQFFVNFFLTSKNLKKRLRKVLTSLAFTRSPPLFITAKISTFLLSQLSRNLSIFRPEPLILKLSRLLLTT